MRQDARGKGPLCKSEYIYGLHSVREHLRARPQDLRCVFCRPGPRTAAVERLARDAGVPVRHEEGRVLDRLVGGARHQDVVASVGPFRYVAFAELAASGAELLLLLDGVVDPRNLGALLRTAEAAGVGGVILPRDRSAEITPVVTRTSAGATAYLRIAQVSNVARCLDELRALGYWIVGLWPQARESLYALRLPDRVTLVVGGEGKGIRPLVLRHCDFLAAIPMRGRVESLNASVAGGIALFELVRRRLGSPPGREPP